MLQAIKILCHSTQETLNYIRDTDIGLLFQASTIKVLSIIVANAKRNNIFFNDDI